MGYNFSYNKRDTMDGAAFLLTVNFFIGVSFATAFLIAARGYQVPMAPWCAAAYLSASVTVAVEALADVIPWERLTFFISSTSFLLAITLIAIGTLRQYHPSKRIDGLIALFLLSVGFDQLILFGLERDSLAHAFGYQGPLALIIAIAGVAILRAPKRRTIDTALALLLLVCAGQFLAKGALAHSITTGADVRSYIVSLYANVSQTMGAILSLLLGLVLLGVVIGEVVKEKESTADLDELSGILTRRAFFSRMRDMFSSSARGVPACFIMCDLDHFKSINDKFGHATGDRVIRAFGNGLSILSANVGFAGRVGGEEFAVCLYSCERPQAILFMEALRSYMAQERSGFGIEHLKVTASFGVAFLHNGESLEAVMEQADHALYFAKRSGRDCYRFATDQDLETSVAT